MLDVPKTVTGPAIFEKQLDGEKNQNFSPKISPKIMFFYKDMTAIISLQILTSL